MVRLSNAHHHYCHSHHVRVPPKLILKILEYLPLLLASLGHCMFCSFFPDLCHFFCFGLVFLTVKTTGIDATACQRLYSHYLRPLSKKSLNCKIIPQAKQCWSILRIQSALLFFNFVTPQTPMAWPRPTSTAVWHLGAWAKRQANRPTLHLTFKASCLPVLNTLMLLQWTLLIC